jgi:hypothetical protein
VSAISLLFFFFLGRGGVFGVNDGTTVGIEYGHWSLFDFSLVFWFLC